MNEHIEAIRAAVADRATAEQKAHGAQACRLILAALDAEPGKTIAMSGGPTPHPLASIDPGQALDLLIAKLTAALPKADNRTAEPPRVPLDHRGLRIVFVTPPTRSARAGIAQRRAPPRRKP